MDEDRLYSKRVTELKLIIRFQMTLSYILPSNSQFHHQGPPRVYDLNTPKGGLFKNINQTLGHFRQLNDPWLLLYMAQGYYQIELEKESRKKTVFITKYGLFEHARMGFGFTGAPAPFRQPLT